MARIRTLTTSSKPVTTRLSVIPGFDPIQVGPLLLPAYPDREEPPGTIPFSIPGWYAVRSLFRRFTVEVFVVFLRFGAGMVDNPIPMIRR